MAYRLHRPALVTRRTLIRTVASGLLAAPALIVIKPGLSLADGPDPMRPILCPEEECGYRYNPALGDPEHGIPPGTPFEDLPADWECPECGTEIAFW